MSKTEETKQAPGNFGHILKDIRLDKGYTRQQLAERADISIRYLSSIENEQRKPSYDVLYRLFHSLGISADTIFYPNECHSDNSEAERIKRLYLECSERDRILIKTLIDKMLDAK